MAIFYNLNVVMRLVERMIECGDSDGQVLNLGISIGVTKILRMLWGVAPKGGLLTLAFWILLFSGHLLLAWPSSSPQLTANLYCDARTPESGGSAVDGFVY
jgi:hypothetical protein